MKNFRGFSITVDQVLPVDDAKKIQVETMHGCNGTSHAGWTYKVSYDENDQAVYIGDVATKKTGLCDGTCSSSDTVGEFLFDVA